MKILVLSFWIFFSFNAFSQSTVIINNVNVVDVRSGRILPQVNVLIQDNVIQDVSRKRTKLPEGTVVIDGRGRFLMPGMTDGHIHFFQSGSLYTRPDAINLTNVLPYDREIANGKAAIPDYFRRYLRLGITTIADVGGPMRNFAIRDSIAKQHVSPHVLVTGPLFSMIRNELTEIGDDMPIVRITSTAAADSLLNVLLPLKPDYIKIWYIVTPDLPAEKTFPIVKYIADRTHQAGLKLAVHATQLQTATLAIDAGADLLVHSIDDQPIPASLIKRMAARNVTYIPTLTVMANYYKTFLGEAHKRSHDIAYANPFAYGSLSDLEWIAGEHLPPYIKPLRETGMPDYLREIESVMAANLKAVSSGKVNVVAGTDAGNIGTMHASSYLDELKAMHSAGMTIPDVIRAATINAAVAFTTNTGAVEKGREADLILLRANPIESLDNLTTVDLILHDGRIHQADTLVAETPEMVVQRQLNAYNARDLEAFLDTYSDDISLYMYPDTLTSSGKEAIRTTYGEMFKNLTYLHCKIEKRIVIGNKVIDHEQVKFNNNTMSAVAIYEVTNGKITKVTFLE